MFAANAIERCCPRLSARTNGQEHTPTASLVSRRLTPLPNMGDDSWIERCRHCEKNCSRQNMNARSLGSDLQFVQRYSSRYQSPVGTNCTSSRRNNNNLRSKTSRSAFWISQVSLDRIIVRPRQSSLHKQTSDIFA